MDGCGCMLVGMCAASVDRCMMFEYVCERLSECMRLRALYAPSALFLPVQSGPRSSSLTSLLHANMTLAHHIIHTSSATHIDTVHARDILLNSMIRRDADVMKHVVQMCAVLQGMFHATSMYATRCILLDA